MASYDGAESCELVGAYLLHKIKERFGSTCVFGLYRDDGLGISNASPRQTDLIKKDLCDIFRSYGLKITIEANKKLSTSSMSHSACLLENTRPTPNPDTSHSTSTRNQTIHLALSKTFRNLSTNGCPKSPLMNIPLMKRHPFIRKPWMTAATITGSPSHHA